MTKSANTVTKFSKESQLLRPVARFANQLGFQLQRAEVQFYEYRIDLYGFSKNDDITIAIELKLNDWRRALEQALLYQLCSDLVYIALPWQSAKRVDLAELRKNGIGLLAVFNSRTCSCIVPAAQHQEVRTFYRSIQIEYLKDTASA